MVKIYANIKLFIKNFVFMREPSPSNLQHQKMEYRHLIQISNQYLFECNKYLFRICPFGILFFGIVYEIRSFDCPKRQFDITIQLTVYDTTNTSTLHYVRLGHYIYNFLH